MPRRPRIHLDGVPLHIVQRGQKLVKENFISQHGYLEPEQARIEQEQDLASSRAKVAEIRAALAEAKQEQATLAAETRGNCWTSTIWRRSVRRHWNRSRSRPTSATA